MIKNRPRPTSGQATPLVVGAALFASLIQHSRATHIGWNILNFEPENCHKPAKIAEYTSNILTVTFICDSEVKSEFRKSVVAMGLNGKVWQLSAGLIQ